MNDAIDSGRISLYSSSAPTYFRDNKNTYFRIYIEKSF
jgi:hypothetical protein